MQGYDPVNLASFNEFDHHTCASLMYPDWADHTSTDGGGADSQGLPGRRKLQGDKHNICTFRNFLHCCLVI